MGKIECRYHNSYSPTEAYHDFINYVKDKNGKEIQARESVGFWIDEDGSLYFMYKYDDD